jgi:hypothetical protein
MEAGMRFFARLGYAVAAALLAVPAQAQVRPFDGNWSVEIITDQGDCDRAYRYSIRVENGRVRYDGPEAFEVTGQVRPTGAVTGSIARGNNRATVTGRLRGAVGSGTWRASGSRECSGRWNAEKRG